MAEKIVVIGAGPGGYVAALKAAQLGGDVTVVEKEHPGGTCLNWGCIPSKIMKTSADLFLKTREARDYGIKIDGGVAVDMAAIMARKQQIMETQRKGILALLKKSNVQFEQGRGYIKEQGVVSVADDKCWEKEIHYDRLILAVGTEPLNISQFPFDGKQILSSNDLLTLESLPQSLVIVGGGVIGCEFACILSALGVDVTVVEAMNRLLPLPSVDEGCSKILQREMKKRKIKFITDQVVETAEKNGDLLTITLGVSPFVDEKRKKRVKPGTLVAEKMAVCIGRSALSGDLGLENIGLDLDDKGWIPVNQGMGTGVDGVYAIGDILGPRHIMLAHVASHEGMVAAENAMGGSAVMDYTAVPGAIFTMPEIGNVGLTQAQAREQGLDVTCASVNFRTLGKAQAIGEIAGEAKIVADTSTGKVLGVHITGPHATDLIAEGALAVTKELTVSDLAHTIHAHPTLAEIMSELAFSFGV
ncbi:dihydrolipoamide dehydrogenase [Desulfocicer vacuolatum DSM 3385]|uniref:Dihydrolipoyl dehydrogenase n=1 Tax=Desulfocicer vacuolatum DSM 3385 TaxID=1121400 RepID=A0A1W1Z715_9BACT|nr:dihydrolipoyl dehydrogenase [Desulfocicer vacuolatum]SMC44230.1 dihydrolipoamide dehydrogenase [Desulfocicer vacuolatum DSM 3385]